ncbi:hypothetical protein [Alicyclobacillus sp. SO9]|uniref:hypothetical protein n=1 Tax=Alicyclobacillus sp. SO9 TaxID=2665646 RepID=UPI0018E7B95C|nr:hypothetical protein [Alicyclobacillus sp. SO9]QQE79522.1 hypothetical protein GI364_03235 [Alicyclobacillus sp. SO9]
MKSISKGAIAALSAVGMLALSIVPAFASTTGTTVTLNPGSLTVSSPSVVTAFPAVTLNGQPQQVTATLGAWTVVDATGSGNGWKVDLTASQLTEVQPSSGWASGTSAKKLPLGSLSLSGQRSIVAGTGSTPVSPTNGPVLQNQSAAIDTGTPVTLIDTQPNYGMGMYTIQEPKAGLTLSLSPKTAYTDPKNYPSSPTVYATNLQYTVSSGP